MLLEFNTNKTDLFVAEFTFIYYLVTIAFDIKLNKLFIKIKTYILTL